MSAKRIDLESVVCGFDPHPGHFNILKPWGIVILIPHAYSNYRMSTERDYDCGSSLRIFTFRWSRRAGSRCPTSGMSSDH